MALTVVLTVVRTGDEAALGGVGDGVEDVMLSWPEAVVREGWCVA